MRLDVVGTLSIVLAAVLFPSLASWLAMFVLGFGAEPDLWRHSMFAAGPAVAALGLLPIFRLIEKPYLSAILGGAGFAFGIFGSWVVASFYFPNDGLFEIVIISFFWTLLLSWIILPLGAAQGLILHCLLARYRLSKQTFNVEPPFDI